jgi:hypothetical protein
MCGLSRVFQAIISTHCFRCLFCVKSAHFVAVLSVVVMLMAVAKFLLNCLLTYVDKQLSVVVCLKLNIIVVFYDLAYPTTHIKFYIWLFLLWSIQLFLQLFLKFNFLLSMRNCDSLYAILHRICQSTYINMYNCVLAYSLLNHMPTE